MSESGRVVNAVSLFGDQDFWQHIKINYPILFERFTDHLLSLPRQYAIKGTNVEAVVNPINVIKEHYPEAFRIIHEARNDFN